MRAVVTGASGLLGGNLALELIRQGHSVVATRRPQSKIEHLKEPRIQWVEADLSDTAALERAFKGADAVFHCAAAVTIRRKASPTVIATNVGGTKNVLEAFARSGAKRLVYCSTAAAVGLSEDGEPCTEESRWNFPEQGMNDGYSSTKHEAQSLVIEAAAKGADIVIVHPTYMFGPYDVRPSSGRFLIEVARRKVPGVTPGLNNFVDVRDVARGMILACEKGKRGERYILGNENLHYGVIFDRVSRIAGTRPITRRIPRWAANVFGWAGDLLERFTDGEPFINSVIIAYGFCQGFQFSSEKAKRELGYAPGPLEPAIKDALDWFRANGML